MFVLRHGEHIIVLVQQIAATEMQHCKAGLGLGLTVAHHVRICQRTGGDQLLLPQGLYGIQAVPQGGGYLEFQIVCGGEHIGLDLLRYGLVVALEQLSGLLHALPVGDGADAFLAPALALVHVVVQAWPVLAHVPWEDLAAPGQLQRQPDGLQQTVGHAPAAVGAKILRPIIGDLTDNGDGGVNILHIQPQIGIALVILQKNVVFGHIALDQRAFQHQGFKFTACRNGIKMVDLADHHFGLWGVGGGVLEILADPVFQLFGLTHIDDLIGLVPHDIHAGSIGQRQGLFFQFFKCHGVSQRRAASAHTNRGGR